MAFDKLTSIEQAAVLQCLSAILEGPFIDDFEFQTRLGYDKDVLKAFISTAPHLDENNDGLATSLINNCMNEIC